MPFRTAVRSTAAIAVAALAATLALAQTSRSDAGADVEATTPTVFDAYAFPGSDPTTVVFAFDVSPRTARGVSPGYFDPSVLYAIDIDNVGDAREHLVMQFKAAGTGPLQKIEMFGPAVPSAAGPVSTLLPFLGAETYNTTAPLDKGVTLFAGPRRDPFFFDRARFERIASRKAQCFSARGDAQNAFGYSNVLAIVVEVPRTLVAPRNKGRINFWSTASIAQAASAGAFLQVSRAGRPGIRDLVEGPADRAASDRSAPYDDARLADDVRAFAAAPPAGESRSGPLAEALARLFVPDEIAADVEAPGPATYLALETATPPPTPAPSASPRRPPPPARPFGGRALASPAMARTLDALYGDLAPQALLAPDDGRETPCLTSDNSSPAPNPGASSFPYLDAPV